MLYMVKAIGSFPDGTPAHLFFNEVKIVERVTPKGAVRAIRKQYEHIFGPLEVYVYQHHQAWFWDLCCTNTENNTDYAGYCWTYGPDMEAIQSSPYQGGVS